MPCTVDLHVVLGKLSKISMCNQCKIERSWLPIGQSYFHFTGSFVVQAWYLQKIPEEYTSARNGQWLFQGFLESYLCICFLKMPSSVVWKERSWALPLTRMEETRGPDNVQNQQLRHCHLLRGLWPLFLRPKGWLPEGWGVGYAWKREGEHNNIVIRFHSDRWLLELVGCSHCKV